ncbi:hypothetical protein OAG77_01295 [bacterium]|jgi:hypothetical protein|nr:hypothetical protein [Verrucomicrobiota bacterium]MDB4796812.1 hypothetical protein [bacterium]
MLPVEADPFCSLELYLKQLSGEGTVVPGIPMWLSVGAVVAILLVSHLLVRFGTASWGQVLNGRSGANSGGLVRFDLLTRLARKPIFPIMVQSFSVLMLLLVIISGLFGHEKNSIGPVLTWTWWWALLVFMILGFGNAFCMVCPWEAFSSLITSLSLRSRVKKLCFDIPWPKWARNVIPAAALFVGLTWLELGRDVTHSASVTAILALGMTGAAVLTAIIFEKRAFCRYVCLVGRVSGIYSLFSPVELRPDSAEVCRQCTSKACYHGTETTAPCPTNLFPGNLKENNYCTLCTECVRSCPHENLSLRTRPLGRDLFNRDRFSWDESLLVVLLLALTSFHGFTMTPIWARLNQWLRAETGMGASIVFTLLMGLMIVLPMLVFWGSASMSMALTRDTNTSIRKIFRAYAYSLIPVALFYHLAHNSMHFFLEAGSIIPLLSDPLGKGWDLFGTAHQTYGPLLRLESIWWMQIVFIVIGHVYGVLVADRISGRIFQKESDRSRGLFPLLGVMILYSCFSVWLISQPMDMKTAM